MRTIFIKAKDEDGEMVFINLQMVSTIRETNNEYRLNLLGNIFLVDKDSIIIQSVIKES